MSKSYKDFFGNLNKELYESKKQINEISDKEVNLDFIERFSRKIYLNPSHLAKLEMIQYILCIVKNIMNHIYFLLYQIIK